MEIRSAALGQTWAHLTAPGNSTFGMRSHADSVTVWTTDGRLLALDRSRRSVLANLRIQV